MNAGERHRQPTRIPPVLARVAALLVGRDAAPAGARATATTTATTATATATGGQHA